jgi:hypothetical protein
MQEFCHSCTAPLSGEYKGPSDKYCKYCTDDAGNLKPREEIREGLAQWMTGWQGTTIEVARKRAEYFMKALPAWADD